MPIVGEVLADRYRIDGILGAGGMAFVYRATDLRLEREVALKVLLPNLARDASLAGRFDREARLLAAIAHPSVAAIFDVEPGDAESGREPFYVMELCDGGSFADRLEATGAIAPDELVPILVTIGEGLAELHRHGIVHRDVKPGNILFAGGAPTDGGRPKLADFGLAKSGGTAEGTTLTAPGTMVGTLPYLAPELLAGGPPTAASDVYALGTTAFQALTGKLPKPFDSLGRFVDARRTPAPAVSSVLPDLGASFDAPIAAALAIDPATRPTASDLADSLTSALAVQRAEAAARAPGSEAADRAAAIAGTSIDPPTLVLGPAAATVAASGATGAAAKAHEAASHATRAAKAAMQAVAHAVTHSAKRATAASGTTTPGGGSNTGRRSRGPRSGGAATGDSRILQVAAGLLLLLVLAVVALGGAPLPSLGTSAAPTLGSNGSFSLPATDAPFGTLEPSPSPEPLHGNGHGHHRG